MAAESRKRRTCVGPVLACTVGCAAWWGAGTPAAAQDATDAQANGTQDRTGDLPPATIAKGPAPPPALVLRLRRQVRDAVARTRAHALTAPTPAGAARRLACDLRDVGIELVSGDAPGATIAATVAGQVRTPPVGGAPAGAAATARFALLYVYAPGSTGGAWRLTLAKYRPETPMPRGGRDEPSDLATAREPQWQDLWSGEPGARERPGCMVAAFWRRLGPS